MSNHGKAGTDCVACHGPSAGHIKDERDNIKPDRIPRKTAIAGLCITCHAKGCPNSLKTADCQSCHHVHALIDPRKEPQAQDDRLAALTQKWQSSDRHVAEGERLLKAEQWQKAQSEFQAALADRPGNQAATDGLAICEHHLKPGLPGFDMVSRERDSRTGLPLEVRIPTLGVDMVLVPGGGMDIGSEHFPNAQPVHTVRVESFYLGKFEVTQAEWKALMGSNPSAHAPKTVTNPDKLPVNRVSWQDAQAFVQKLNERVPGGGFRLPTEAEWEFAARAGRSTFAWDLERVAWFNQNPGSYYNPEPNVGPVPVGSRQPNHLGLFDMQGNVWEWCSSLYAPYPYNATDGRESLTAPGLRVLRGGGYADTADYLDPAFRHGERPEQKLPWNGLRIARTVPPSKPTF
jgi:formylglycine-generating enzyme required for sulfatase activity